MGKGFNSLRRRTWQQEPMYLLEHLGAGLALPLVSG
jgi:hypothetical protein